MGVTHAINHTKINHFSLLLQIDDKSKLVCVGGLEGNQHYQSKTIEARNRANKICDFSLPWKLSILLYLKLEGGM